MLDTWKSSIRYLEKKKKRDGGLSPKLSKQLAVNKKRVGGGGSRKKTSKPIKKRGFWDKLRGGTPKEREKKRSQEIKDLKYRKKKARLESQIEKINYGRAKATSTHSKLNNLSSMRISGTGEGGMDNMSMPPVPGQTQKKVKTKRRHKVVRTVSYYK